MLRKGLNLIAILLVVPATIGATWVVAEESSDPDFRADVNANNILGYNWTVGLTVHLTIDDPDTEDEVDYENWLVVPDGAPYFSGANVFFATWPFELQPGQIVILDDGAVQRELTITTLTVSLVDPAADTISGTADAGAEVTVYAHTTDEFAQRFPIADDDGYWLADFSEPGSQPEEQDILDITQPASFWVHRFDEDSDSTCIWWSYDPHFEVRLRFQQVWAREWLDWKPVTLTIYNSGGTELWSDTQTPVQTSVNFDPPDDLRVEPGQIVRMNDGVSFKEHIVQDMTVTNVNVNAELVAGSAAPGAELVVNVWQGSKPSRQVTADGYGLWEADFSAGEDPYDVDEETTGAVSYTDDDSDSTVVDWNARIWTPIDIKPGSSQNSLNLGSKGMVAVAVLTWEGFDASTADPTTVEFAGATPVRWVSKDVDGDGDLDLLLSFTIAELVLDADSTAAYLTGETFGGRPFAGWDSVNIVP